MSETACYTCGSRNLTTGFRCNTCKVLDARRETLRAVIEWQPIETAPKDGTDILIYWADAEQMAVASWDQDYAELDFTDGVGWRDGSDYGCGGMIGAMPTHWMPLPVPPA